MGTDSDYGLGDRFLGKLYLTGKKRICILLYGEHMHELSIAQEILRMISSEQARQGFQSVSRIKLRAGALSGINPRSLQFAFEVVRADTCAARAEIEMEVEPLEILCRTCGHRMKGEHGPRNCPQCGSPDVMLDARTYFEIVSLEVT